MRQSNGEIVESSIPAIFQRRRRSSRATRESGADSRISCALFRTVGSFSNTPFPGMGKRVDAVVLYKNIVFLLEFKCGDTEYRQSTYDRVYDYALDLRNFQKESHDKMLVPIVVSTKSPRYQNVLTVRDHIVEPIRCNAQNLGVTIDHIRPAISETSF